MIYSFVKNIDKSSQPHDGSILLKVNQLRREKRVECGKSVENDTQNRHIDTALSAKLQHYFVFRHFISFFLDFPCKDTPVTRAHWGLVQAKNVHL